MAEDLENASNASNTNEEYGVVDMNWEYSFYTNISPDKENVENEFVD